MISSWAYALSFICSIFSRIKGGKLANCLSYSRFVSSVVIGCSSKCGLGLGCTSQSTAECNARLFKRGRV